MEGDKMLNHKKILTLLTTIILLSSKSAIAQTFYETENEYITEVTGFEECMKKAEQIIDQDLRDDNRVERENFDKAQTMTEYCLAAMEEVNRDYLPKLYNTNSERVKQRLESSSKVVIPIMKKMEFVRQNSLKKKSNIVTF